MFLSDWPWENETNPLGTLSVGEKRKGLLPEIINGREDPAVNNHASQTLRCLTLRKRGSDENREA